MFKIFNILKNSKKKTTSQWLTRIHRFLRRNVGFGLRYLYIYYNQMAFCVVLWDEAESHTGLPRSCEQVSWTLRRQGRIGPWGYKHLNPRMKHCLFIKCSPPQYTLLSWAPPRQQKGQTVQLRLWAAKHFWTKELYKDNKEMLRLSS